MNLIAAIVHLVLALTLSPLLLGIIHRVKAKFAGRKGPPLLQPYYDLFKLARKGAVYSTTTSWVFRMGPALGLGAVLMSILIMPSGGTTGLISFAGDFILAAYLLGLARFATMLAALDTGSAFEGMGSSREAQFAIIAEVVLLLGIAALAIGTQRMSLSVILHDLWGHPAVSPGPVAFLLAFAFLLVLLAENARIPVDDPNTHLELTMIHEVMVLDHGGVDLAMIQYGASLKLWFFAELLVGVANPYRSGVPVADMAVNVLAVCAVAAVVGIIESAMARLRLLHVPQMLVVALSLTVASLLWMVR